MFFLQGLSELLDDLVTMEMLVYECGAGDNLTLEMLREMSDYARLELMMDKVRQSQSQSQFYFLQIIFRNECSANSECKLIQGFSLYCEVSINTFVL
jgi:hypothetical protein